LNAVRVPLFYCSIDRRSKEVVIHVVLFVSDGDSEAAERYNRPDPAVLVSGGE